MSERTSELIKALRNRKPVRFYPQCGGRYHVQEWDGTGSIVKVLDVRKDAITFRYADGLVHSVTPEYFVDGLHASGVR